jgi:hypothetical protein
MDASSDRVTAMNKSVQAGLNDCREIYFEMYDEYMHKEENITKGSIPDPARSVNNWPR